jgi:hypothetical protein
MKIIDNIEQGSEEWLTLRKGGITGTDKVMALNGNKYLTDFWKILASKVVAENESTEIESDRDRGLRLEDEAIQLASKKLNIKLYKPVAICISDEDDGLMYSPDRLAEPVKGKFVVDFEAKCFEGPAHLEAVIEDAIPDKTQMLRPFTINPDLMTRYYVFYHDRIAIPELRLHIKEIKREDYEIEITTLARKDKEALNRINEILSKYF